MESDGAEKDHLVLSRASQVDGAAHRLDGLSLQVANIEVTEAVFLCRHRCSMSYHM